MANCWSWKLFLKVDARLTLPTVRVTSVEALGLCFCTGLEVNSLLPLS